MTFLLVGGSTYTFPSGGYLEDYSAAGTNHARLAIDFNNAALLGTHDYGQVSDQFEATTGVFDRPLFRFRLRTCGRDEHVRAGDAPALGRQRHRERRPPNLKLKIGATQVASSRPRSAAATGRSPAARATRWALAPSATSPSSATSSTSPRGTRRPCPSPRPTSW